MLNLDGSVAKLPLGEVEPSFYESSMKLFWETAKLLDVDPRVCLELSEPHHELIFHISVDINNRLVEFTEEEYGRRGRASRISPRASSTRSTTRY